MKRVKYDVVNEQFCFMNFQFFKILLALQNKDTSPQDLYTIILVRTVPGHKTMETLQKNIKGI